MPAKSESALAMDALQRQIAPSLKAAGFRVRSRTFNRVTPDGLTQVINFQMSRVDPPGTPPIPGFREVPRGKFTVNLGIHVPEVAANHGAGPKVGWVQEYSCCIRARIGALSDPRRDLWWSASDDPEVLADVRQRIDTLGIPYLERFRSRDLILAELEARGYEPSSGEPPRIVCAIILALRNDAAAARRLLLEHSEQSRKFNPVHAEYVRALADKLRVGWLG